VSRGLGGTQRLVLGYLVREAESPLPGLRNFAETHWYPLRSVVYAVTAYRLHGEFDGHDGGSADARAAIERHVTLATTESVRLAVKRLAAAELVETCQRWYSLDRDRRDLGGLHCRLPSDAAKRWKTTNAYRLVPWPEPEPCRGCGNVTQGYYVDEPPECFSCTMAELHEVEA